MDGLGKLGSYRGGRMYDDVISLMLGRHREYGDDHCFPQFNNRTNDGGCTSSVKPLLPSPPSSLMSPVSSTAMPSAKRSRASYQNMQNPCCQVEGCNLDLKLAKDYHRRHRICEMHSKSPKVIVSGMERRFCQQCSRFHELSEFDDKKRSCRRRLSDHNARRRRLQPESIHLSPSSSSPAIFGQNLLLNGLPISLSNNSSAYTAASIEGRAIEVHNSIGIDPDRVASNPEKFMTGLQPQAPDLLSAHSLLSSSNWRESSSMMNYDSVIERNRSLLESNAINTWNPWS